MESREMETVTEHIHRMADLSRTEQHEVILECLEFHGITGTRELTVEMAEEFWRYRNECTKVL